MVNNVKYNPNFGNYGANLFTISISRYNIPLGGIYMPCECCKEKKQPRSEEEIKQLKNRIHRMVGQLNGIEKMLDENRYCGDVLIQISAIEKALQNFGYIILQNHLETCVSDDIKEGNLESMEEVMDLIKRLK